MDSPSKIYDNLQDLSERLPNLQNRPWYRRLDYLSLLSLVLGSLVLLVLWLLLALFWAQSIAWSDGTDPWELWNWIVQIGWASRFVTICTAVMRSVISLQASISTAMVAALILEVVGVPIRHAPYYSTVRVLYPSPSTLLQIEAFRIESFRIRDKWTVFTVGLLLVETVVTIASQFLSTIYLSSLPSATVLNDPIKQNIPILTDSQFHYSPWTSPSPLSRRFAELSEAEGFTEGSYFHDTGHTYRAFLPFEDDSQRPRLREYSGPVQVMNQRAVCVSPTLTELTLTGTLYITSEYQNVTIMNITGQLGLDQSFSMLENTPTPHPINFDCQLNTLSMPNTSLCYPYTGEKKGDVLREKPKLVSENELRPIGDLSRSIIPQDPTFILIFQNISYPLFNDSSRSPVMTERIGPWTHIKGTDDASSIRVTACSINFGTKTFFTHLSSAADGPEPNILWDNGVRGYNTDLMRRQLVASPNSPSLRDRGLLSMQPRPEWRNARDNAIVGYNGWLWAEILMETLNGRGSSGNYSMTLSPEVVHQSHIELFHDTMDETHSPAFAIQALFSRLCSIIYYDHISTGNGTMGPSTVRLSTELLMPVAWSGFAGASCIIATHILVMVTITILFFWHTKRSVLGNQWQAVSQVVSVDIAPILREADRMTDMEVNKWAKSQPYGLTSTVMLRENEHGRIALRKVKTKPEELVSGADGQTCQASALRP